jgi:hypothetical protein
VDRCRSTLAAVVAAVVIANTQQATSQPGARSPIVVSVFDYARVTSEDMANARAKVAAIFSRAGVDIVWSGPSSTAGGLDVAPGACDQPFVVQVMIRPRRADWAPQRKRVMGEALAADDARAVLSLFYDAIFDVALRYNASLDGILAVALTHEMGHSLLPAPAHARTGVMQARWEGDDIRHAIGLTLDFNAQQSDQIRAKVERRCQPSRNR